MLMILMFEIRQANLSSLDADMDDDGKLIVETVLNNQGNTGSMRRMD